MLKLATHTTKDTQFALNCIAFEMMVYSTDLAVDLTEIAVAMSDFVIDQTDFEANFVEFATNSTDIFLEHYLHTALKRTDLALLNRHTGSVVGCFGLGRNCTEPVVIYTYLLTKLPVKTTHQLMNLYDPF